ncbi:MAG TPA: VWA domain-containing protein, partial [Egibacteraceae bacterium]|nr:VWA domain-containing protein [Egibacteraceae bacterium]
QDQVGVLVFNTQSEWVLPLQSLPADDVLDGALARIHPVGDTNITQAVREAIDGLRDADARLRHIVLFTDGFTSNTQGFAEVAQEAADAGITLSVVGTGEGAFPELRQMAATGGGRYYPGRDLASIPDIIALEVRFAARPIITEGRFLPTVTGVAPATEDLDVSPPLLGYLATTAKPTAQTLLVIGDERDPLLATWRAGLGTTTAWTSDASPRWSAQWVTWDRFSRFWSDVVKDTFPVEPDPGFALSASATSDGVHVRLETDGLEGAPADVDAVAVITSPGGEREEVQLDRTSLTSFEATAPAGATDAAEGVYAVSARLSQGDEDLYHGTVTAIRAYSPEYGAIEADPELLARAVEAAGGRLDPEPASIFDPVGLSPGVSARELWAWLALLALILLPIDIGLRRLQLERADWARAKAWVRARARGGVRAGRAAAPAQRSAASDALFAAKARARGARPPDQRTAHADQRTGHADQRTGHAEQRIGHAEQRTGDAGQRAGEAPERDRPTGAPPSSSRPPAAAPPGSAAGPPPARGPETSAPGLVPPPPGPPPAPAGETASSSAPDAPADRGMAALRAAKARARAEAERRGRGDERPPGA